MHTLTPLPIDQLQADCGAVLATRGVTIAYSALPRNGAARP